MNIKALAVAAVLATTMVGAAHAAETLGCCKGEECCCNKDRAATKDTAYDHMNHDKGAQPTPQASPKK